jgi:tetratricopeptide (TPR) repeat protein
MLLAAHDFTAEAVAAYDKAHELEARDWRWPYLKALALEHDDPAQSLDALKQSVQLGGPVLDLARALLDSGQPVEAESILRNNLNRDQRPHLDVIYSVELGLPRNESHFLLLARAFIQQGKYDLALKALNEITDDETTRKTAQELLSHVHTRLGNHREAENARRAAESLPPDRLLANALREELAKMHTNKEAYIAQVNQLRHLGRFDELERVGQEGFARFPELTYFSQGKTALLDGKPADAEAAFRQALGIDSDWIDALIGLGDSLAEQNKQAAAEEVFRDAIKREPSNGSAHLRLANCLMKQDKHKSAVESFQQAVRYLPLSADAHSGLAEALGKIGRDADADEHRRHAEKLAAASKNSRENK